MDLVRSQQYALTVPADQLPELPANAKSRTQRAALPEGISPEDAELAERMAKVLTAGCQLYLPSPYTVCGAIRDKYNAMGGPASFLGIPTSPEYQNPGNTGARSEFLHGSIYWSAATGAHPITPLFMTKWSNYGWEAGQLGYPTTDEIPNGDNIGSRQDFHKENAAIYWNSAVTGTPGLTVIKGLIRAKWDTTGAQTPGSLLGYPTEDERALPDGQGHMSRFQRGVIYWHPTHGAHPVTGTILSQWASAGYEQGPRGYPTADQVSVSGVAFEQQFQTGKLYSPKPLDPADMYANWGATGSDQCPLPLASRVGAWVCGSLNAGVPLTLPEPSPQLFSNTGTFCSYIGLGGCWTVHDDFRASYEVTVFFGRENETFGSGDVLIEWQLEGPYTNISRARMISNSTKVMDRVTFRGMLFNGAVGVAGGGGNIHTTSPVFEDGPFYPGSTINVSNKAGLVLEDRRADDHNYFLQFSVEFEGLPGYWYFYARSPVSHYDDGDPDDIYRFLGPNQLPGDREWAGWNW